MQRTLKTYGLSILIVIAASRLTVAQHEISWSTVDGGGATSTGGSYDVSGTIGQPDAGPSPAMIGETYELTGGFWSVSQVCYCPGDMNGDGKKDGRDVQQFVGCIMAAGNCSCADVDQANGVTLNDVSVFVSGLLSGANCS